MAKIENKSDPSTCNLGSCSDIFIEGFDGDDKAVLALALSKPVMIDGYKRTYAGLVLDERQLGSLARQIMGISKRKSRSISLSVPSRHRLVKPVRFV